MVDLLGQKLRQSNELSPPKSRPRPLSPLSETFSVADGRRFSAAAISPRRPVPPQPATPLSPPAVAAGRRQTLAAENRCMLLAGLGEEAKRRQSVPNAGYLASPRDTKRHQLEQLRAWGHVYLGDAKSCDVFVQAMALRRPSDASSTSDNSAGDSSPTHLSYVRFALPVLAAFIVSGHINTGDVIDLPMPHPEAWASTVAYVYTGQGDVTDAVRENILYLAGKA
ncbi:hypothetical protein C8035_v000819 [Colletotrichum spinosum]|uniref:Uncharacterized protein n=1 Tax=Colletotrichum spinosum TaxID=1347390 RepID=A0A4R8Q285_9PEZI|nr:hypothetical protein C8035_v000819 [Colletotrichum spinosum]